MGQITGEVSRGITGATNQGFILSGGRTSQNPPFYSYLIAFESHITHPYGINDSGQVVGRFGAAGAQFQAFLYDASTNSYTELVNPDPTSAEVEAHGINDEGVIVGSWVDDAGNTHGFIDGRTGRVLQLQWLHDERELKGPCLGEVLEDVDHATEVRVHRDGDDVLTFPICEQRPARSASSSRDNPTSTRATCRR